MNVHILSMLAILIFSYQEKHKTTAIKLILKVKTFFTNIMIFRICRKMAFAGATLVSGNQLKYRGRQMQWTSKCICGKINFFFRKIGLTEIQIIYNLPFL